MRRIKSTGGMEIKIDPTMITSVQCLISSTDSEYTILINPQIVETQPLNRRSRMLAAIPAHYDSLGKLMRDFKYFCSCIEYKKRGIMSLPADDEDDNDSELLTG